MTVQKLSAYKTEVLLQPNPKHKLMAVKAEALHLPVPKHKMLAQKIEVLHSIVGTAKTLNHRRAWRIRPIEQASVGVIQWGTTGNGGVLGLTSLEFRQQIGVVPPRPPGTGTVLFKDQYDTSTYSAGKAFDDSTSTVYSGNGAQPQWLGWDYGADFISPVQIFMKARVGGDSGQAPTKAYVEYNDTPSDPNTWVIYAHWFCGDWVSTGEYTLILDPINTPVAPGTHRYWRLANGVTYGGAAVGYTELQFRRQAGVAENHSNKMNFYKTRASAALAGYKAFDGSTSTVWASSGTIADEYIGIDYGSDNVGVPVEIAIYPRPGADVNQAYREADLQWSDDSFTWTTDRRINFGATAPTAGTYKLVSTGSVAVSLPKRKQARVIM